MKQLPFFGFTCFLPQFAAGKYRFGDLRLMLTAYAPSALYCEPSQIWDLTGGNYPKGGLRAEKTPGGKLGVYPEPGRVAIYGQFRFGSIENWPPFRYLVLYDADALFLIGWWDLGKMFVATDTLVLDWEGGPIISLEGPRVPQLVEQWQRDGTLRLPSRPRRHIRISHE